MSYTISDKIYQQIVGISPKERRKISKKTNISPTSLWRLSTGTKAITIDIIKVLEEAGAIHFEEPKSALKLKYQEEKIDELKEIINKISKELHPALHRDFLKEIKEKVK